MHDARYGAEPARWPREAGVVDLAAETVWCYGAQSYRAFGTAAEHVVVPAERAVPLPEAARSQTSLLEQAACLGIAGITGHRAVFAAGPVAGLNVLVWGAASDVGAVALQMAHRAGARVLAVVRRAEQLPSARAMGAAEAWLADDPALVEQIRHVAPEGVHRVADVDFAAHIDVNAQVVTTGGVISAYYSSADRPDIPYWKLAFADVSLRLLGSDDFPPAVKAEAARESGMWTASGIRLRNPAHIALRADRAFTEGHRPARSNPSRGGDPQRSAYLRCTNAALLLQRVRADRLDLSR